MRTIETKVYRYDELSESAKQFAIDSMRTKLGNTECEIINDEFSCTLDKIKELFNIRVRVHDSYGKAFCTFDVNGQYSEFEDEPRMLVRWINNEVLPYYQKGKYYSKYPKSRRSKVMFVNNWNLTGCYSDDAVDKAVANWTESVKNGETIRDFIENMLDKFMAEWNRELDYCYTDECIAERLEWDDFEFLESGKPYLP